MAEITRQLRVTFSKDEISQILSKHAKALVLTKKEIACVELSQVEDVEGEATVILIVGAEPITVSMRDKMINARAELIDYVVKGAPIGVKYAPVAPSEIVAAIRKLTDRIDGREPIEHDFKIFRLRKKK